MASSHHPLAPKRRRSHFSRSATATLVTALLVALSAGTASAAAADSPSKRDELAAQVQQIQQQIAAAERDLERATVQAEAASDAARAAQDALAAAQAAAAAAATELAAATAATDRARADIVALGRAAYMGSDSLSAAELLLDASGPAEMLQRAATLDLLGADRAQRLELFEAAETKQQRADQNARKAVAQQDAAARAATNTATTADAQLTASQATFDSLTTQKTDLDRQLRDAEIQLLAAQGDANPAGTRDRLRRTELAEEFAGTSSLVAGRVTSCFGARSGAMHNGVDIAAPIGTPIFAPAAGTVIGAGPATGFGLAVYIQHPDGTITVYGHINQFFVTPGQTVAAGDRIAEVGNRGQSTGPHLHIETHTGGLYQNRVNPAPWLAARGISLAGACT